MLPVRLVLDTNIVVSAAIAPGGLQRTVFLVAITKPARLYVSPPIFDEYRRVLARPELRIPKGLRSRLLQLIGNRACEVDPKPVAFVTKDPSDRIFLDCAEASRADHLITDNLRHFPPYWKSTKIVDSREFMTMVAQHLIP